MVVTFSGGNKIQGFSRGQVPEMDFRGSEGFAATAALGMRKGNAPRTLGGGCEQRRPCGAPLEI